MSVPLQPPEPGPGSPSMSSAQGAGSSMVQQNGAHKPPQMWPPASNQSAGGTAAVQSWRYQNKRQGQPPADPQVMLCYIKALVGEGRTLSISSAKEGGC